MKFNSSGWGSWWMVGQIFTKCSDVWLTINTKWIQRWKSLMRFDFCFSFTICLVASFLSFSSLFYYMQNMWLVHLYSFWTSTATLNSCSWKRIYCFNVVIVDIILPLHFADCNNFHHQGCPQIMCHR